MSRRKTEAYFVSIGLMPAKKDRTEKWVLHHPDEEMIHYDKKRHDEFRVEDVIPMPKSEHCAYHNKTRVWVKDEEATKQRGLKHLGNIPGNSKNIKCIETDQVFTSISKASQLLGIGRQYIRRALNNGVATKGYHFIYL